MITGFRASIDNDTHRIFLHRLSESGVKVTSAKSSIQYEYTFVFMTAEGRDHARVIAKRMQPIYKDLPIV